jgi:hypothetical protein
VGDERASQQQLKYRKKEVKGGKQFFSADVKLIDDEFTDNSLGGHAARMVDGYGGRGNA